ncbi:hypothetical protein M231_03716 [Tremella mesenterica]|uniref:chitin deacetylase n=1 Tax=Tremella mesenterica TaxID=5217 RepID=A0A4Q1BMF2_TREME|nr:hypothetical protein M231_03716 [Tremella mesenterica]
MTLATAVVFAILGFGGVNAQSSATSASGSPTPLSATGSTSTAAGSTDPNLPQTPLVTSAPFGFQLPALSELTSGQPTESTVPLDTTYTGGVSPTAVSGAPTTPTGTPNPANYPALDVIPSTNSSLVQSWLAKIDMSKIPNYGVTSGDCAGSPGAITDGRCWWTCGGCTRETDITECPDKLTWGLSFDDGPSPYTPLLLDYLDSMSLHTTFFIVGSRAISRPEILLSEYMAGHQLSVHTWSHPALTTLTNEQIVAELAWTMQIIHDVTGVTPNTFRPPYGDIDDRVRAVAAQMGLTPIIWSSITANGTMTNFDTTDWNIPGGEATGETALAKFDTILDTYASQLSTGFIVLAHDLYQQTVDLAVGYVLPGAIQSGKFQLKSIIECLGRPLSEAYIETSSNTTATLITSAASTFFQPTVGTGTGTPVTPTSQSASGSVSGAVSGSASTSGSSASASSSGKTGAATERASFSHFGVVAAALLVVGMGMTMMA